MLDLDKPILKVSQVAQVIEISTDRLRTYDEENLILPSREKGNTRLYSYNDIDWLVNLRKLIAKNCLSIMGFKEILRISYFLSDDEFEKFIQKQNEDSIWHTISKMRKNPNYLKLKEFYI